MKIDLPVSIIFDCQEPRDWRAVERGAGPIVCTLRYETDDINAPAKLYQGYPPANEKLDEPGDVLLAFMPSGIGRKIRLRAAGNPYDSADKMSIQMDITAVHKNGAPLKLQSLLEADDFNFGHDVWGIERHLNRETGRLTNHFLPRFAA